MTKNVRTTRGRAKSVRTLCSELELARMGVGNMAYIHPMTPKEAHKLFPSIEGIPNQGRLYALFAADGSSIALTDTLSAAVGHAEEVDLELAPWH